MPTGGSVNSATASGGMPAGVHALGGNLSHLEKLCTMVENSGAVDYPCKSGGRLTSNTLMDSDWTSKMSKYPLDEEPQMVSSDCTMCQ